MQVRSALSSTRPLQYCWVSKLSLILTCHHGEHKWDQPSGKNSDKPVSPLFREHCVWWPAKLPQACLGENRGFWKPSSLHSQPRSYSGAVRAQREKSVSGSVWGACKTIEFQLKGLCRVHTSSPLPPQVASEQRVPHGWTCWDEGL